MARHPLKGSERAPLQGARSIGKADPAERFEVSVVVRQQAGDALKTRVGRLASGQPAGHVKREDFARQFGAAPADLAAIRKFAGAHKLAVVQEDAARRTVVLSGTVAQFNAAFAVDLQKFEHPDGSYRGRVGAIQLPDELKGVVEAVLGLDNRPQARPHFRTRGPRAKGSRPSATAAPVSYTPLDIAALYGFPGGTGNGECIGIIELGGGYRPADLATYFQSLNLTAPAVAAVSVDHGSNQPTGDPNGPDGEVMLDIEVAGAVAPDAGIAVYFAPNTDAGFHDAVTTAIHDTTNKPSVISISWGGPESTWTQQAMTALDQAFQAAAAMGITVCVAAGDGGSSDGVSDGADHVDFPASSPYALACGGTSLRASGGHIASETVWNDGANGGAGGGGVSTVFPLPAWQDGLDVTKTAGGRSELQQRGVPDVAGDADPETGYDVRVDGSNTVIGGTSAVAPLWAGLITRINSSTGGSVGYINPQIYKSASALNDITKGNNGDFRATAGWDACTGMGSPNGTALLSALPAATA
ncbi:MAG: protease pro-enzyme activation domain-containing protein [Stellaceae bacterium]